MTASTSQRAHRKRALHAVTKGLHDRLYGAGLVCVVAGASACLQGSSPGTLVGKYAVRGVLVENTCGQSALPAVNPLTFVVELREDQGVGYWVPDKAPRNTGSLSQDGSFRFTVGQTQVISQGAPGQATQNLQPSDFLASPDTNFDLKQTTCAVTTTQTIVGSLQRKQAADGGIVISAAPDGGALGDLIAESTIAVAPSAGSDCNSALAALGGNYVALPCQARYELQGQLATSGSANTAGSKP
jgi:hypothetical protein